jgi:hypothetical protein
MSDFDAAMTFAQETKTPPAPGSMGLYLIIGLLLLFVIGVIIYMCMSKSSPPSGLLQYMSDPRYGLTLPAKI